MPVYLQRFFYNKSKIINIVIFDVGKENRDLMIEFNLQS